MRKIFAGAILAAALAVSAGCNNGGSTPVGPTTTNAATTDTFSGNLAAGQTAFFTFVSVQAGEIDVVLTADATTTGGSNIPLLVQLGTASTDGSTCAPQSSTAALLQLGTAPALSPFASQSAGTFCGAVTDYFTLGPVNYTITVTHH